MRTRLASTPGIIAVLMSGTLLAVSQLYLTVPLMPEIADRYQVAVTTASLVGAGFGAAYGVGNLIFGTMSDRFDPRLVMALGLLSCAVATAAAGLSTTFEVLLLARIMQGFTSATVPPVALSVVGYLLPQRHRAVGIAGISSCFLLGGIVGQGYALAVDRWLGWPMVFFCMTAPMAACAGAVSLLPARGTCAGPVRTLGRTVARFGDLLLRPPLLATYLCALAPLLTFVALYSALNDVAVRQYGIEGAVSQLALRLPGLPGIALGACSGMIVNRFGPYRTGGWAFLAACSGMVAMAGAGSLSMLLAGSAVYVAGLAVAVPSVIAAVGLASGDARGTAIAGYTFLIGCGGAAAPVLVTMMAGAGFPALVLVCAAALAVAAASIGLGPRPQPQPNAAPQPQPRPVEAEDQHTGGPDPADIVCVGAVNAGSG